MRTTYLLTSCLSIATGCAANETFSMPMTAAELARADSGAALVAYLGQHDATPAVCDPRTQGPRLAQLGEPVRRSLIRGLIDGSIEPDLFRRCADVLLRGAPREASAAFIDAIAGAYEDLSKNAALETSPALKARLAAMQTLYLERDPGLDGHTQELASKFADLRRAVAEKRIGPVAARFGRELLVAFDLERGAYQGRPVDLERIEALHASGDEPALRLFAARLPRVELRDEARRRIVRMHIARSPFREVRETSAAVEAIVTRLGVNPASLVEHPPSRAWIDASKVPPRAVLVRQDVLRGVATLLGYRRNAAGLSIVPEVGLHRALFVELAGISRPVTVCGSPKDLDPSPCVAAADVKSEHPLAFVDGRGSLRFIEHFATPDAVALADGGASMTIPLRVGTKPLAALAWPLTFERPAQLVFEGERAGGNGPPVSVFVGPKPATRVSFAVRVGAASFVAIVERDDVPFFRVASRGAAGASGVSGMDGASGSSGGTCQNGSNGSSGNDGGAGSPGGNGGAVQVHAACDAASCAELAAMLARIITSEGGSGGPGGAGGRGGSGGAGGPAGPDNVTTDSDGRTTTTPGCSAGSAGSAGSDGSQGASGPDGRKGPVSIVVEP